MNVQDLVSRFGGSTPALVVVRANQHLPVIVSVMAVTLIGYYLARIFWIFYPAGPAPPWQPPQLAPQSGPKTTTPASYATITAAHLFGEVSQVAPPVSGDAALTAPDTSLALQLRGAVAADNPKLAHAIIADGSGNEQVYFVNSTLPGGATVQQIQADRVVLARAGRLEVLRLPREGGGAAGTSAGGFAPPQAVSPPGQPNVQELIAQNAPGFLAVVRPQPFMPNGQLKGYRIYPGPNRQGFSSLGLRAGDLVTEINGVALNNPAQGMEVFRSLGDALQVTVTVERDGQPQVMSLNMAQVNAVGATQ
ncbi:MAG: type II secretion system protein GspC [Gammaproteobacteria bacterium]|nr:type II secretion system protein GspC [Gammaproteobacteria bacterium]